MKRRGFNPQTTLFCTLLAVSLATGCSSMRSKPDCPQPDYPAGPSPAANQQRAEPLSNYGNPASYRVFGECYYVMPDSRGYKERGRASWYGKKFHGRRTSSGETYDMHAMTAAHRSLPLPTYVRVTNLENGKQVVLRVNDRGPFHSNRIIDLSYAAAVKLDMIRNGTAPVEVEALDTTRKPLQADAGQDAEPPPAPIETRPIPLETEPTMTAQPAPAPAQTETTRRYYLQVGAFSERSNADQLLRQLASSGLQRVEILADSADELYRVLLGPYADATMLSGDRQRLSRMGLNSHIQVK